MSHSSPENPARLNIPKPRDYRTVIFLDCTRHQQKASTRSPEGTRNEELDIQAPLTELGRLNAHERGRLKNWQIDNTVVVGSARVRTRETGLLELFHNESWITPDMTLDMIRSKVTGLLGSKTKPKHKDREEQKLDYSYFGMSQFGEAFEVHYKKKKGLVPFLWRESDELVQRNHDTKSTSFSRLAGNVAEVFLTYLEALPRCQQIAAQKPEEAVKFNHQIVRLIRSSQGVLESFLIKVIEKLEGKESVERNFLSSLPDGNGFGFSQGYTVKISQTAEHATPTLAIEYGEKTWVITRDILEQIIQERDQLDASMKSSQDSRTS